MPENQLNPDQQAVLKQLRIYAEAENNVFKIISKLYNFDDSTTDNRFVRKMAPLFEARAALHRLTILEEAEVLEFFSKWIRNTGKMDLELEIKEAETIISVLGMADYISVSSDETQTKPQPFFQNEKLEEIKTLQERIEQQRRETFVDESPF